MRVFGKHDGRDVPEVVLQSAKAAVSIIGYGASVRDWRVDGPNGTLPMVLGFASMDAYSQHAQAHGAITGRLSNRTSNGRFTLGGQDYQLDQNFGPHHLHGGHVGLQRRIWEMDYDSQSEAVRLSYDSPDGEAGYPGNVRFAVTYRLEGSRLICEMEGHPDRPTPINLAQHNYYNLGGGGDVRHHILWVDADHYLPTDSDLIPEGTIQTVAETDLDFRTPTGLCARNPQGQEIDNCFVLSEDRNTLAAAAKVHCESTEYRLNLYTSELCLQVFDAAVQKIDVPGHDGVRYDRFSGLCLEPLGMPDAVNNSQWPSQICTPDQPYSQKLVVDIHR